MRRLSETGEEATAETLRIVCRTLCLSLSKGSCSEAAADKWCVLCVYWRFISVKKGRFNAASIVKRTVVGDTWVGEIVMVMGWIGLEKENILWATYICLAIFLCKVHLSSGKPFDGHKTKSRSDRLVSSIRIPFRIVLSEGLFVFIQQQNKYNLE